MEKRKPFRERIIKTSDLFSNLGRRKKRRKILTTSDLPLILPNQPTVEESKPKEVIKTSDIEEKD